jgi:isoleucyl-tRNA synthetase
VVHAVQNARKASGLAVEDRIELELGGDEGLLQAAEAHEAYVTGETLAVRVIYGVDAAEARQATIEGRPLRILTRRAG